jgi:hypothetical protein
VQREPGASEWTTKRHELVAELVLDVGDHAIVGGGRAGQHGYTAWEQLEDPPDAPVVGVEVVTPVADAVRLVDHEQPAPPAEHRHHVTLELGVGEPLRRDEQQIDLVAVDRLVDLAPVVAVL